MFDYRSMTIFECLNLLVTTDRPVLCDADWQCAYLGELEEEDFQRKQYSLFCTRSQGYRYSGGSFKVYKL
jgi:hypothetical protein|nr:MAG: hypothetical protein [Bacteriophage sp.]